MKDKLTLEQEMLGQAMVAEGKQQSYGRMPLVQPKLFILIGQVGAGKSSVAKYIAQIQRDAVIVNANEIRLRLRKIQESYNNDRLVGENVILGILTLGYSVIADSDHGDERKRKSLLSAVKGIPNLEVHYIRVHCDFQILAERVIENTFNEGETIYSSAIKSDAAFSAGPVALRLREFWRRTPHHYDWVEQNGGEWKLKEPPMPLLADLDTGGDWQKQLDKALATLK